MKLYYIIILILLSGNSFSQTHEVPSKRLLQQYKIKTITTWLCRDTLYEDMEQFLTLKFDKHGNMTFEMLGDINDTSYLYLYTYDNVSGKLMVMKGLGDFLCNKQDRDLIDTTFTKYFYDDNNLLVMEHKTGGCCDVQVDYIYDDSNLIKKVYNNSGCRYSGEVGEILYKYDEKGRLFSEKNLRDNYYHEYSYDEDGNIISILEYDYDKNNLNGYSKFQYTNNLLIKEIESFTSYDNGFKDSKMIEEIHLYKYDKRKLITEIFEMRADEFILKYVYRYEYY